jgi:hypothetical protein
MLHDSSSSSSSSSTSSPNNKKLEISSSKSSLNTATSTSKPSYYLKLPHSSTTTTTTTTTTIQSENTRQNNNKMPEMITMPILNGTSTTSINNQRNKPVNDIQLTQKQIDELKESIKLLNDQIFKDPNNRTRPPSEYIEVSLKI